MVDISDAAALHEPTTITRKSPEESRAEAARLERMRPLVISSNQLLQFAASHGMKVDDALRRPLVTVGAAVDAGSPTMDQELEFLRAYEGLAGAMAPMTAESLAASRLPTLESLRTLKGWSLILRYANIPVFTYVLMLVCVTLGYYYQGSSSMSRYIELTAQLTPLSTEYAKTYTQVARSTPSQVEAMPKPLPSSSESSSEERPSDRADSKLAYWLAWSKFSLAYGEWNAIPERLGRWARSPCLDDYWWSLSKLVLCSNADVAVVVAERATQRSNPSIDGTESPKDHRAGSDPHASPDAGATMPLAGQQDWNAYLREVAKTHADVERARIVLRRLSEVYLPLLLGLLGAYAYVLRKMSAEIADKAYTRGAFFNQFIRVGLGALAGLASTWLLTPDLSGLLPAHDAALAAAQVKRLPVWALAFVAGYSIELVFAFMDRIVGTFSEKSPTALK